MTARLTVLLACALVAGCGGVVQERWEKAGVTRQDLTRDHVECEREARYDMTHGQEQGAYGFSVPKNDRVFVACMRARGYERVTAAN